MTKMKQMGATTKRYHPKKQKEKPKDIKSHERNITKPNVENN